MNDQHKQRIKRNGKQWLWFIGIYIASVIAVGTVVYLLRWIINW